MEDSGHRHEKTAAGGQLSGGGRTVAGCQGSHKRREEQGKGLACFLLWAARKRSHNRYALWCSVSRGTASVVSYAPSEAPRCEEKAGTRQLSGFRRRGGNEGTDGI